MEKIKVRKQTTEVKGIKIQFDEYYKIDEVTGEELFDRNLEIENDMRLYDAYKKHEGLLTIEEVKKIRQKYGMNQKEYALAIGVGEITVHRFENGSIQTDSVDAIMRLSKDPDNMCNLLMINKKDLTEEQYQKFINVVAELQKIKKHHLVNYNIQDFDALSLDTIEASEVATTIINKYNSRYDKLKSKYSLEENISSEYITNLKLQKLLYYVQGLAMQIFNKPAFNNKIVAWTYGPVIKEIYQKYKNQENGIKEEDQNINISDGLDKIIDLVIDSYGTIEASRLIDLTHEEEPWINTIQNEEITLEKIKDYFNKVYSQ